MGASASFPTMQGRIKALEALSDPCRLRILWLLCHVNRRISVAEAMYVLGISRGNASRHLATLEQAQLLAAQQSGETIIYMLNKECTAFIRALVTAVGDIPATEFETDIQRYQHYLGYPTALRRSG